MCLYILYNVSINRSIRTQVVADESPGYRYLSGYAHRRHSVPKRGQTV